MKKQFILLMLVVFCLSVISCAPIYIEKCYYETKYDAAGHEVGKYSECIKQQPESMPPIHLKHKDLYE